MLTKMYDGLVIDMATSEVISTGKVSYVDSKDVVYAGGGGSTTETRPEPWKEAQPYLKDVYGEAKSMYQDYSPEYYGGQTQAGFSGDEMAAQSGIRDWATKGAPNVMNSAMDAYGYGTSGQVLDVAKNPYVKGMAQSAAKDAFGQLNPQLANIRSGAIQSGGYGGGRQGIAEGGAMAGAFDSANKAAAGIYSDAYGKGLDYQGQTLGQTGDLIGAGFKPYAALGMSGGQQSAQQQALMNDAQQQWNWQQNQPYAKLNQYGATLGGTAGLIGSSTNETKSGGAASALGAMAQMYGVMNGVPTASDKRLKTNIEKVGEMTSGINIYTWDWIKGAEEFGANLSHTTGVLAQEVMKVIPEAVSKFADGYYRVDYSKVV